MHLKEAFFCSVIFVFSLCLAMSTAAQDEARHVDIDDVEVGDLVEAKLHREWHAGTVTEVINNHLIRVKFDEKKRGLPESFMFREQDVRFREIDDPIEAPDGEAKKMEAKEPRSWKSGEFTVNAGFLKMDSTHVWLKRDDGETLKIERKLLSEPDQKYLEEIDKENPFGKTEQNPFQVVKEPAPKTRANRKPKVNISPLERKRAAHTAGMEMPLTEPLLENAQPFPAVNLNPWKMPSISHDPFPPLDRSFSSAGQSHFLRLVDRMPNSENLLIATSDLRRRVPGLLELGENKTVSTMIPAKLSDFSDIHSSGEFLVSCSSEHRYSRIDLWKYENSEVRHHSSWEPPTGEPSFGKINKAKFAGDFLVTLDGNWRLGVWDWRKAKLLYQQGSNMGCFAFEILPDKKHLVYVSKGRLHLLEIESGDHLGSVPCPYSRCSIDIADDGKLAAVFSSRVMTWDKNGKLLTDFRTTNKSRSTADAKWFDNRILLVQHSKEVLAVDTDNRVTMARYSIAGNSIMLDRGGRVWRIQTDPKSTRVDSLDLEPMQYESALPGSGDELLLFQPGTEVEIAMDLPFDEDEKREIKSQLKAQLSQRDVEVVDSAPLKLTLEVVNLESRVTKIQGFGIHHRPWGGESIRIKPKQINIRLAAGENRYYSFTKKIELPHLIHSLRDETTQETVDRLMEVKPSYFAKFKLPLNLTQHPSEGAFALINIDANGNKTESFPSVR